MGALIVILATLIFFAPSYGWDIRQFLSPSAPPADTTTLAAQNALLKAQIAQLEVIAAQAPSSSSPEGGVVAMVYSRYPMDFKNELLVNVGSNEGIAVGAAATFQGILIGQVKSVSPESSVVQTIFDNALKMPVRIGSGGYDGLLRGGSEPMVGSITSAAPLVAGDVVYSAAPGLPYGLPIAEVAATSTSADSLFEQASLNFSYDINTIQTVAIIP